MLASFLRLTRRYPQRMWRRERMLTSAAGALHEHRGQCHQLRRRGSRRRNLRVMRYPNVWFNVELYQGNQGIRPFAMPRKSRFPLFPAIFAPARHSHLFCLSRRPKTFSPHRTRIVAFRPPATPYRLVRGDRRFPGNRLNGPELRLLPPNNRRILPPKAERLKTTQRELKLLISKLVRYHTPPSRIFLK